MRILPYGLITQGIVRRCDRSKGISRIQEETVFCYGDPDESSKSESPTALDGSGILTLQYSYECLLERDIGNCNSDFSKPITFLLA
ncbi:hypothetical protein PROFUN_09641 [Planoprotostelium fungivorum]|uniref:Uncharacterized protein n=1 Tax=Planoprotostelium fungivorum TaxID=1890364 RepID=A0A2P6MNY4_9EUKA|nr:hypothetical protein PROFUN_09641 [Planoprotostelium fungivorum]